MIGTPTSDYIRPYDVVILGSGYAGLIAALRLGRPKWGLRIALINVTDQFIERLRATGEHRSARTAAHSVDFGFPCRNHDRIHPW